VGGGWTADMSLSPIDVLFVGNSTLAWAIDTEAFERQTGRTSHSVWTAYSAMGWWYLVLDRVVARAPHVPKLVVICFNDNTPTLATMIVDQGALDRMSQLLDEDDRRSGIADRVAGSGRSSTVTFVDRHWPLVRVRTELRKRVEQATLGYVGALSGGSATSVEADMARVFALERKDKEQLDAAPASAAFDTRLYDFVRMKDRSFLPDLLDSAEANRIPLIFVRMPRKQSADRLANVEVEAALRRYNADLDGFLEARGYPVLDFSSLRGLDPDRDFEAGDHLSDSGRAVFMPAVTAALEPYLPQPSIAAADR